MKISTVEILELIKDNIVDCHICDGSGIDCGETCSCFNGRRIDLSSLLGIISEDELDEIIAEKKAIPHK